VFVKQSAADEISGIYRLGQDRFIHVISFSKDEMKFQIDSHVGPGKTECDAKSGIECYTSDIGTAKRQGDTYKWAPFPAIQSWIVFKISTVGLSVIEVRGQLDAGSGNWSEPSRLVGDYKKIK